MLSVSHQSDDLGTMVQVTSLLDLHDLIRQSELDTGTEGRSFLVGGAERLAYTVKLQPCGYEIVRSDTTGHRPILASLDDIDRHAVGHAMAVGCLFTKPIH